MKNESYHLSQNWGEVQLGASDVFNVENFVEYFRVKNTGIYLRS